MTRTALAIVFFILAPTGSALCAPPGKSFAPASHPAVRYIGRVDRRQTGVVRFDWPGVAVEARFEGSRCAVLLRGDGGLYDVVVDGRRTALRFDTLLAARPLAAGLADTIHSLRIVKRDEGLRGEVVALRGFYLDPGRSLRPPLGAMPARRVEFVGGSNLLGFGAEADTIWCDTPANFSNVSLSFGAVAARELGAEGRVLAISGKGLVRNWMSPFSAAPHPLGQYYPLAVKNDPSAAWDFKAWVPQTLVACFGTNDFSTRPHPPKALFIESYRDFLDGVRARYPGVQIVCVVSAREPARSYVRELVERERAEGNARIHFFPFGEVPMGQCGCDWHPNAAAHESIGKELAKILEPLFGNKIER
jgi:hypothetical protein